MSVTPSPIGGFAAQFFDNNGVILSGGKIYTYAAGTTTPQTSYTSASGTTPHANPIILDSAGRVPGGEIWLTDGLVYKFVIETATGSLLGTYDNITGVNSNFVNYTVQEEVITATAGQTVFNLTTINYTPGTNSLTVYIDGVNQYVGDSYLETDSDTVTFTAGLHVGAEVKFTTAIQTSTGAVNASIVAYDPPFTGGVATNVEDKLAQYVSVKDFGAVGDGVADDTAAIQAAIDYLNPYVYSSPMNYQQGGGTVFLPNGNYLVSSTIRLPSQVILAGTGCQPYQATLSPSNPYQGSTIFADAGFTGSFILDSAGYDTVTGLRYTSSALPANLITFTESCGIRDIGFVNSSGSDLDGVRLLYSACAKLHNVSTHGFQTGFLSTHVWNAELKNLYTSSSQIGLFMYINNIVDVSGQFDCLVFNGVGNDVTVGTKPSWWDAVDTVYASTCIYMRECQAVEFTAASTQHGSRAVYSGTSSANFSSWYAEDFEPTIPTFPSYIAGSALLCANNGSVSTTPVTNNNQSVIVINLLHSESNGVTVFDSIYNSSISLLGFSQPNVPGAGVGILYGPTSSTGQKILIGNGVLRNGAFPDTAYDSRLIYIMPITGSFTPTSYSNIGGTVSTISLDWIQTGNVFDVTLTVTGTALTTTNAVVSTPFVGTGGYAFGLQDSAGSLTTAVPPQIGSVYFKFSDANLYLTNLTSTTKIVANFTVIGA